MAKKIVVVGTGYVGLPAAIMLADAGHEVVGVDINQDLVESINDGTIHIEEEELHQFYARSNVKANLVAQQTPCAADVFILAVPTPLDERKKVAEMRYVREAMVSILPFLAKDNLVIIESTIPPLTCREMLVPMIEAAGLAVGDDVMLAHCPERILPGKIFHEIVYNDRLVGGVDDRSCKAASDIYGCFVKGELFEVDDVTAELCKLMENTYRDVNIALANEFAAVGETLGIDINRAIALANRHPRVDILRPGIGVGGHCIPIDPWFIKEVDPENCTLIFAARRKNDAMPAKIAGQIRRALVDVTTPKIVALGATYKKNTYDLRGSPAVEVVRLLRQDGYNVDHYDPYARGYEYKSLESALDGADCAVVLVEHDRILEDLEALRPRLGAVMRREMVVWF